MKAVNVTVRVDEDVKKEFDIFCDNVGMNITTAFNMFIRATLRARALPFPVTDTEQPKPTREALLAEGMHLIKSIQDDSVRNGTDHMTMEEIDAVIAESRRERRAAKA
jgi:DNA-damage-inducible protein J